ncbi:MAG: BamA/TamA family outer membrane protein [Bryobacteraceae bacterium]
MSAYCARIAVLALAVIAIATAQTRTGEIERARDQKAVQLQPETVSSSENVMLEVKRRKVLERLTAGYNGLRATIGGMATGSGFAAGPDFLREDFAGGRVRVNASALISTRLWQKYQAGVSLPHLAGDHLLVGVEAVRRDYRSLEFYGPGPDSRRSGRTAYRLEDTNLEGVAAVKPFRRVRFGASLGGLWTDVRAGRRDDLASTETVFTDAAAPGLAQQPNLLSSSVFGQYDWRDDPFGPKSGGNYVSEYTWYSDQSLGAFSFRRWDVDIQQYIPFFNRTRRIALRARMTMTDPVSGHRVPFYMRPYLGGSDDLRGFRPYRFTDRNAVVYNAEYRWEIFSGLDGAVFFDAGKVMPHRGYLGMSDLEVSPGFGLRFNAGNRTFVRLDVGVSHEGAVLWLKFNDPFLPRLFGAGTRQPLY